MSEAEEPSESSAETIYHQTSRTIMLKGTPLSVYVIVFHYLYVEFSFSIMSVLFLEFMRLVSYNLWQRTFLLTCLNILVIISPLIGGIMADCWFGQFNTIFYLSTVYISGYTLLTIAAVVPANPFLKHVSIVGYLLILIGCVGLNPCAVPFAGDQFKLPAEQKTFTQFFTYFYVSLKIEDCLSSYIASMLEIDMKCFGEKQCYTLPFGISAWSMTVIALMFFFCRPLYVVNGVEGNILLKVVRCVSHAISNRRKARGEEKVHWLDYASDVYDEQLIEDIKTAIRCLLIYVPLSCFSITHDIITSGWSFMATRMNGQLGNVTILPLYMDFLNPILITVLAPLFHIYVYPFFARYNLLQSNLYRMQFGGLFLALSFILSGVLIGILKLEYPMLPGSGHAELRIYNSLPCKIHVHNVDLSQVLAPLTMFKTKLEVREPRNFSYKVSIIDFCPSVVDTDLLYDFELKGKDVSGHQVTVDERNRLSVNPFEDDVTKNKEGFPNIRNLVSVKDGGSLTLTYSMNDRVVSTTRTSDVDFLEDLKPGTYTVRVDGTVVGRVHLKLGGVYAMLISFTDPGAPRSDLVQITTPNKLHMLWLVPQYVLNAIGEILFAISGLYFTYTQAPVNLKSVMEAAWIFPSSIANIIIIILERFGELDHQLIAMMLYFFFYLFFFLIVRYLRYVEH